MHLIDHYHNYYKYYTFVSSIFDVITDATPIMNREGAVYPYVRASALGYGLGDKEIDNEDGKSVTVCNKIADKCKGDGWDYLSKANEEYEVKLGRISETNSMPSDDIVRTR